MTSAQAPRTMGPWVPDGGCFVSLVVVGNRWVTIVIGPVRQDRSKSLHGSEGFDDLMRGHSRAGLGRGFPDLVHRIFKPF
jgi:hypothetical protein